MFIVVLHAAAVWHTDELDLLGYFIFFFSFLFFRLWDSPDSAISS